MATNAAHAIPSNSFKSPAGDLKELEGVEAPI